MVTLFPGLHAAPKPSGTPTPSLTQPTLPTTRTHTVPTPHVIPSSIPPALAPTNHTLLHQPDSHGTQKHKAATRPPSPTHTYPVPLPCSLSPHHCLQEVTHCSYTQSQPCRAKWYPHPSPKRTSKSPHCPLAPDLAATLPINTQRKAKVFGDKVSPKWGGASHRI